MEAAFDICCGVDVGKGSHHFVAIDKRSGELVLDEAVMQDEGPIREVLESLSDLGRVMLVVDQPGSLSSLLLAIADDIGVDTGFLTPTAMAKAIEMYGAEIKTDAHDARIIAEVCMGLPQLIKPIDTKGDLRRQLATLMSYDRELTADVTRAANRLHDLLLSVHPSLERLIAGDTIKQEFYLLILERYGGPTGLRKAGRTNVRRWVSRRPYMNHEAMRKVDQLFETLDRQVVKIEGSEHIEELIKLEATYLHTHLQSRKLIEEKRSEILKCLPEAGVLLTLPGLGPITCATFIVEVGDISRFPSAAKLASYAGLAPRIRQSGKSIHSVSKPKGGNRRLKRALFLSASVSILCCDESKDYYDKKRSEGRCHTSTVISLARRRLEVMYAMLRDNRCYEKKSG